MKKLTAVILGLLLIIPFSYSEQFKIAKGIYNTKGKYRLTINIIDDNSAHKLKAPVKGNMTRFIHECPALKARISLLYKNETIFDVIHQYGSFEYVY